MKTNVGTLYLVVAMAAAVGWSSPAFALPTHSPSGSQINPPAGLPQDFGAGLPPEEQRRLQAERERLERQTPSATGSLPDLAPLQQAQTFREAGQYDQALQCYLRLFPQAGAAQDNSRLPLALSGWMALGEKYPKAKQALVDLRDQGTRECLRGRGDAGLFQEVAGINAALEDDGATVALFKDVRQHHPSQAEDWYFFAEPVLVRCGAYQLCLDCIGNPETRFDLYCRTFQFLRASHESMTENLKAARRKMEEYSSQPGRPPMPVYPHANPGEMGLQLTRDNYANEVRRLIEILVGTGHGAVAEKIQDQAVAVLDDPRLQAAVRDAQAHIKEPGKFPSSAARMAAVAPPSLTGFPTPPVRIPGTAPLPPPAGDATAIIHPATGRPMTGTPTDATHIDPVTGFQVSNKDGLPLDPASRLMFSNCIADINRVNGWPCGEYRELLASGRTNEAAQRLCLYHRQLKSGGYAMSSLLVEWFALARQFPQAMETLMAIRDDAARELSAGRGGGGLFWEAKTINGYLNQGDATLALFKRIHERSPQLAGECYPFMEDWLVQKGEYELCLNCLGDPQKHFESFRTDLEMQRKIQPLIQANHREARQNLEAMTIKSQELKADREGKLELDRQARQSELRQFRQALWQSYPGSLPLPDDTCPPPPAAPVPAPRRFTPPDSGQLATNRFVEKNCGLVKILVATGHKAEAEKIRDEAVAVMDNPRLRSAVADAEPQPAR
jgi:tetratricopeptide (TPR) repeat protein